MRRILPYLAFLAIALFLNQPLFTNDMLCSDDAYAHLNRTVAGAYQLAQGVGIPRWQSELAHGYGYPLYNFYAPLSSYILMGVRLVTDNYPHALYFAFILSTWGAGVTAFWLGRKWWGELGGVLTGVAYQTAPYLAYNIMFRAALAETMAFVWTPLVLLTLQLALENKRLTIWSALAPLTFAGLLYTHNATALGFAPLAAAYTLVIAWQQKDWRVILRGAVLLIGGLLLSIAFWLPALAERSLVQSERLLVPPIFTYYTNFLSLRELFALPVIEDPALVNPSPAKALGALLFILALLGFAAALIADRRQAKTPRLHPAVFILFFFCGYTALTLSFSRPLWDVVPLLNFLQFPWRLLSTVGLCTALLIGGNALWLTRRAEWLIGGLSLLLLVGHVGWWFPRYCYPIEEITIKRALEYERDTDTLGATAKGEFLPRTVHQFPESWAVGQALMRGETPNYLEVPAEASSAVITAYPINYQAQLTLPVSATLTFDQFFYPGWQATLDNQPLELTPAAETGLITFSAPAGTHTVKIFFGSTPLRTISEIISLISFIFLIALAVYTRPKEYAIPNTQYAVLHLSLITLSIALFFARPYLVLPRYNAEAGTVTSASTPLRLDFEGDLRLMGYDVASRSIASGGETDITLYIAAPQTVSARYWFALALRDSAGRIWNDPNGLPPRWHRDPIPTNMWRADQYATWARWFLIPPGTPPGEYEIVGSFFEFDSKRIVSVLDENGNALSPQFSLGTVTIARAATTLTPQHPTTIPLGDVELIGYELENTTVNAGDTQLLTLDWRAAQTPAGDATVTLQLGTFTQTLTPVDDFPTSQWRAGEEWRGLHNITIPAALPSGTYDLQINGATLTQLTVRAPERIYTPTVMPHSAAISYLGVGTLMGYDLHRDGSALQLVLQWQAAATPEQNLRVFVHLADATGRVWAQSNQIPAEWGRPTTSWLAGEFIRDAHHLELPADLPAGEYTVLVGLFDPVTGERVSVDAPNNAALLTTVQWP